MWKSRKLQRGAGRGSLHRLVRRLGFTLQPLQKKTEREAKADDAKHLGRNGNIRSLAALHVAIEDPAVPKGLKLLMPHAKLNERVVRRSYHQTHRAD